MIETASENDWTMDPETGRTNSSREFLSLCDTVERIIRSDAYMLINNGPAATARLIVAQLAHVHGLRPGKNEVR